MESTLREYKSPRKRFCRQHLATLAIPTILRPLVLNFPTELFCKQSPVCGVFWPLGVLPHPSTDLNETRTWSWSSVSPRNLRIKFGANPSTIVFVIVCTDRHTDTQTNAGENIFLRFRGDNYRGKYNGLAFGGHNNCRRNVRSLSVVW